MMSQQQNQIDVGDKMLVLDNLYQGLRRSMAGFMHMSSALQTHKYGKDVDGKTKGLPLLRFPASADGVSSLECTVDVKRVSPDHVEYVLAPLVNYFYAELYQTLSDFNATVQEIQEGLSLLMERQRAMAAQAANRQTATAAAQLSPEGSPVLTSSIAQANPAGGIPPVR